MHSPSQIFAKCFLQGTPEEVELQVRRLKQGQSIMDVVRGQAKRLEQKVGHGDREKLDEYFDSVRDVEQRLTSAESWVAQAQAEGERAAAEGHTQQREHDHAALSMTSCTWRSKRTPRG